MRSFILAGMASPAASASRVSVSARRLTVVSGVRSSWDRLSMNSARICWRRRSSVTSSRTSHTPPGDRRDRTTRVGPSASATTISPLATPPSATAVLTIDSRRPSTNASIAGRSRIVPAGRRRRTCAAAFAASTTRSSVRWTMPMPTSSTRWSSSREASSTSSSAEARSSRSARTVRSRSRSSVAPTMPRSSSSRRPRAIATDPSTTLRPMPTTAMTSAGSTPGASHTGPSRGAVGPGHPRSRPPT